MMDEGRKVKAISKNPGVTQLKGFHFFTSSASEKENNGIASMPLLWSGLRYESMKKRKIPRGAGAWNGRDFRKVRRDIFSTTLIVFWQETDILQEVLMTKSISTFL
jgi:hypothetical protein